MAPSLIPATKHRRASGRFSLRLLRSPRPTVGVELGTDEIAVARVRRRRGGWRLASHALEPVPEGAIGRGLLKFTLENPEAVANVLRSALTAAGVKGGKVSMSLPDTAVRATLLDLPEMPRSRRQTEDLIRFRLKRTLPYRAEDVVVSYLPLTLDTAAESAATKGSGGRVLAVMASRSVLGRHEQVLSSAGLRVGLVSLATVDLINLCRPALVRLSGESGDAAVLNCEPDYLTLVVFRNGEPAFFRTKMHADAPESNGGFRVRNLRREVFSSISYYTEKMSGRTPLPVLLRNQDPQAPGIEGVLEEVGLSPVVSVRDELGVALPDGVTEDMGVRLAPVLGLTAGRRMR